VKWRVLNSAKRERPAFHYAEVFWALATVLLKHAGRYLAALFVRIFLWRQNQKSRNRNFFIKSFLIKWNDKLWIATVVEIVL